MFLKKQILVFPFTLLLSVSNSSNASSCTTLFEQQNYPSALETCMADAIHNLADANFVLGQLYENGLGIEKNLKTALSYYLKAAFNNDVEAQIALGKYHAKQKNYLQSHVFFTLAIDNGSLRAQRYRDKIEQNLSIQELNLSRNHLDIVKSAIDQTKTQVVIN